MTIPIAFVTRHADPTGTAVEQVWGPTATELDIPFVRQPLEGGINLYTTGRSHFDRPKREFSVHVSHGVSDKGNWAHHYPRFNRTVAPYGALCDALGDRAIHGGSELIDRVIREAARQRLASWTARPPRPIVLFASTINPMSGKGYRMSTSAATLGHLASRVEAEFGVDVLDAPHPAQSSIREVTPLDWYAVDVAVADPGSPAYLAAAAGASVILPPGTAPGAGSLEERMVSQGFWAQAQAEDHLFDLISAALAEGHNRQRRFDTFAFLKPFPLATDHFDAISHWRQTVIPLLIEEAREALK